MAVPFYRVRQRTRKTQVQRKCLESRLQLHLGFSALESKGGLGTLTITSQTCANCTTVGHSQPPLLLPVPHSTPGA